MWWDLTGSEPWYVEKGSIYYFGLVTPGDWGASDVAKVLTTPSGGGVWAVTSIHPGAGSGMFKAWEVLGVWNGPTAQMTETADVSLAGRYVWVPDPNAPSATPTPPPDLPLPEPVTASPPAPLGAVAVGLGVLGLVLGYVIFR